MSTSINLSTSVSGSIWSIQGSVVSGADIPTDIFMYENTGTGLGDYIGVCTLQDYKRIQTYQPEVDIAVFGNKYLKHTQLNRTLALEKDPKLITDKIITDVKTFRAEFLAGGSVSQVVIIG